MRKIIAFLLVLMMIIGLTACGGRRNQPPSDPTPADEQSVQPSEEAPPSVDPSEDLPASDAVPEEFPADEPERPSEPSDTSSDDTAEEPAAAVPPVPDEDGWYYDLENVTAYLMAYGKLPSNYITKRQAEDLGWSGGSIQRYKEGAAIGGGRFGNYEGLLPDGKYTECDIDTDGASSRGAKRLVFSSDGHYYYTDDHYETFAEVTFVDGRMVLDYDY